MTYCYLYLIQCKRTRLIKIGITKCLKSRLASLRSDLKGDVRVIAAKKIFNAPNVEKWLHGKYAKRAVRYIGAGKTEWFRSKIPALAFLTIYALSLIQYILLTITIYLILWIAIK